jgi:plastocyanin
MRRPVVVLVALTLAAIAGSAAAAPPQHHPLMSAPVTAVSIQFDAVKPTDVEVLPGDVVRWSNDSVRVHTVTADDDGFDSGRIPVGAQFARRFEAAGVFPYHCTLHPFIRGTVGVHPLLLEEPEQAASPGRPFPLMGRAALPSGTPVSIEEDRGQGFVPLETATVDEDGHFAANVIPHATANLRAVSGEAVSPPVRLIVVDRTLNVHAQRGRHRVLLRALVLPASPGTPVVLQLYLKEHFGWWPVQRTRLDRDSRARFALKLRRNVSARVLLTLPDGATALAISPTIHLRRAR